MIDNMPIYTTDGNGNIIKEELIPSSKVEKLEQDREILKSFIVRHKPQMESWVVKNFGKVKQ